ncbi:N-acetylmannosamine-6-phosphate 2-epimerase [Shimazuella alba]|uniref:Putative N-acetylmannosamine-6-phosphate 2-epimerase n=1 Tax=Shimazuella alba TaxID=2690964 RepID=A0A6I4VRP9_9BACL|nr:N-acetylmannosamine-6-phosphate 2-epimerase [Shimazuella alba]MXQ52470.1 putative N-acetylmannosamine-6-phosphate 2-epimerase [Shimazuella alba]
MLNSLQGGLVVSCQALEDEPLYGAFHMAAMAMAAKEGGAVGIRANGYEDIKAIKEKVNLPMIGILKKHYPGYGAFITPTKADAKLISEAGADIISIDATNQSRPESLNNLVRYIKEDLHKWVMADIATLQEAEYAEQIGCDLVGTTLSGYTPDTIHRNRPDFELLSDLSQKLKVPIVAEGNIESPDQAKKALELGASFVVIGTAITRPQLITQKFVEGMKTVG